MSLPRSIDLSDIGAGPVALNLATETLVAVGPRLQTPKDTSTVVLLATLTVTIGTAGTGLQVRIRQGAALTGAQVGQTYQVTGLAAGQLVSVPIMATFASNFTDFAQVCITAQQIAATGNGSVTGATLLAISF